jgi:hypothetical protein
MEAWRQWLLGRRKNFVQQKNKRTHLTPTGLLMEGDYTFPPMMSDIGNFTPTIEQRGAVRVAILVLPYVHL